MKVVCCAGQKQNGKDTIADYLLPYMKSWYPKTDTGEDEVWERGAFANAVKRIFCDAFGVDFDFIEEWKQKDEAPPGFDMNVRKSLQFIGDGFREIRGNIWIELAFRKQKVSTILSDGRYVNELKMTNYLGGLNLLTYRTGWLNNDKNESEAQMRPLVQWFDSTGMEGYIWDKLLDADGNPKDGWTVIAGSQGNFHYKEIPENAMLVDLFIRNNGGVQDVCDKVHEFVLPYCVSQKWPVTEGGIDGEVFYPHNTNGYSA